MARHTRRTFLKAATVAAGLMTASPASAGVNDYYDFNRKFQALPVFTQPGGDCIAETRALMTCAFMRIYEGKLHAWDDSKVTWVSDGADVNSFNVSTPAGPRVAYYASRDSAHEYFDQHHLDRYSFAGVDYLLRHNGVAQIMVPGSAYTFSRCYTSKQKRTPWLMPIIDATPNNGSTTLNHSITAVGVRPKGVLVQNSWGPRWGKRGRAVLTWNFLRTYACQVIPYQWGDHPLDGLNL